MEKITRFSGSHPNEGLPLNPSRPIEYPEKIDQKIYEVFGFIEDRINDSDPQDSVKKMREDFFFYTLRWVADRFSQRPATTHPNPLSDLRRIYVACADNPAIRGSLSSAFTENINRAANYSASEEHPNDTGSRDDWRNYLIETHANSFIAKFNEFLDCIAETKSSSSN